MASLSWYFDFISPFAYLQSEQLDRLGSDAAIEYKPVLFGALLSHYGHKGPAEIPSKRRFTYRQALWLARDKGIDFKSPPAHPFNPLGALRLAIACQCEPAAVREIFRFIWAEGHRTDEGESLSQIAGRLGVSDVQAAISTDEVKQALRSNTDEAIALGVFGVPTIAVDGELFWGEDMTDMAMAYIADPVAFEDDEMRRVSDLPVGVERPR